jgi:hypothetical protein
MSTSQNASILIRPCKLTRRPQFPGYVISYVSRAVGGESHDNVYTSHVNAVNVGFESATKVI